MSFAARALLLLSIAASPWLCFGSPVHAASGRFQFDSGGQVRSAFVVEHERLKRGARATLIILHGSSGTGLRTRRNLGLEEVIRSQSVVVVYPNATDGKWDLTDKSNDPQMLRDLIRNLVDQRIADKRRVYVLGLSTGGMLALRFACESADALAGAGALIAALPEAAAASCKPAKPLPLILLSGTANPYIPYNGGPANLRDFKGSVASTQATLAPFKTASGCGDVVKSVAVPDRDPSDGSRVFVETFRDCKAPVELIRVENGGHTVPGRWRGPTDRGSSPGVHNNDVDASRLIWDFFRSVGA